MFGWDMQVEFDWHSIMSVPEPNFAVHVRTVVSVGQDAPVQKPLLGGEAAPG